MKTTEMRNDAGVVTGFKVGSARLTRWGVPRIVRTIPGVRLVRQQPTFRLAGPDDFCEFVVDGKTFLVIEPYGDNDHFMVVAEPIEAENSSIGRVRNAFENYRGFFGQFAG